MIPGEVLDAFNSGKGQVLSRHEEQDTHEIFNIITGSLSEDKASFQKRQYLDAVNTLIAEEDVSESEDEDESSHLPSRDLGKGDCDCDIPTKDKSKVLNISKGLTKKGVYTRARSRLRLGVEATRRPVWTDHRSTFAGLVGVQLECLCCMKKVIIIITPQV